MIGYRRGSSGMLAEPVSSPTPEQADEPGLGSDLLPQSVAVPGQGQASS